MNDATEAALAGELERNAEIPRQPGIAAADDDRVDEHMKLVGVAEERAPDLGELHRSVLRRNGATPYRGRPT
ncbi:MAG: hypothetical protein E6J90_49105 [Deltaproteobacteria bacterium]|nr:MAG: hypothetical protein E6J90_49105 [Deltaproteobacteria bacterium]TMQ19600.1 MAG: hypothetical protein E6J91_05905 [Deltaproteobacteria bacterium]